MPEIKEHSLKEFRLRARLPQYISYVALGVLTLTILAVIAGFYRERNKTSFKLLPGHTKLSTDVVAEVNAYERLETDGDLNKYYIKADKARTFSDNHQELENVFVRIYDNAGNAADTMTAQKVLYVPGENKEFTAYMNGDVRIDTRDGLKIKTNNIVYSNVNETAAADEAIEFERENVRGKSFGATVKMGEKRLELLRDVEIETFESPEMAASNIRYAKVNTDFASFDQAANKISLVNNVTVNIRTAGKSGGNPSVTDVKADRASLIFASNADQQGLQNSQLKKLELFDNVHIVSTESGAAPTSIDAGNAVFDKDADRYELNNGAHIVMASDTKGTDARAAEALYLPSARQMALTGSAEIVQGTDYIKGDRIDTDLFPTKQVKYVTVKGDGLVRQTGEARTMSVTAPELNASFDENRLMKFANAVGQSTAQLQPAAGGEYSLVTLSAPKALHLIFRGEGLVDRLQTEGRTVLQLDAGNKDSGAANKRVTADAVNTFFSENGKDIKRAEAIGDAELYIEPLRSAADVYRTTVNAPRFDCDFYPGNNAKMCVGGKKAKTVRVPTVPADNRGTQTILGDQFMATFGEKSNDIERLDAEGNAKFTERDRNAIASQMSYTQTDSVFRLRGGNPTAWDTRSRGKAREIDWDSRQNRSYFRGAVSTTYYSQKQNNNTTPFAGPDKPVFITSDAAEFDHTAETSLFTGNARGWQDNNYVRGDRLLIKQSEGKFFADGNVQSVLYDSKQKNKGKEANVPVYAAAGKLVYDRDTRLLQYDSNVDIRQGTDRMTSGHADIYLDEKNDMSKTVAEKSVVMTQPGRRATGEWVQYTADDEVAVLRGSPASVNDSENGSSQAAEVTFNMRENRIVSVGKTKPNIGGRIRSVYKIKP